MIETKMGESDSARGRGADSLRRPGDRLLFDWRWDTGGRRPLRESYVRVGDFELRVLKPYACETTGYSASVRFFSGTGNQGVRAGYDTRIYAQLGAEKILESLLKRHADLYRKARGKK